MINYDHSNSIVASVDIISLLSSFHTHCCSVLLILRKGHIEQIQNNKFRPKALFLSTTSWGEIMFDLHFPLLWLVNSPQQSIFLLNVL